MCKDLGIKPMKERREPTQKLSRRGKAMHPSTNRKAYASETLGCAVGTTGAYNPTSRAGAPNLTYERREIVNAILYVLRSGCPWRLLPHDLPAWGTVYWYFRRFRREGVWDLVLYALRRQVRQQL